MIPGVLLAILPKCPMCVMAYASAFGLWKVQQSAIDMQVMCSDGSAPLDTSTNISWMAISCTALFCFLIFSLLRNHRGTKTNIAIAFVVLGGIFMIISQVTLATYLLPIGSVLCFLGALMNTYFYNAIHDWLKDADSKMIEPLV